MNRGLVVRAQALDGTWEVIGADRRYGVIPESMSLESDTWGSSRASFDVRRDSRVVSPDLGAFTPIDVEEGGGLIWSGRVIETPSKSGGDDIINVQCEGWQYHLDDDVFRRGYVITDLGSWADRRSFLDANLGAWRAVGQVTADSGSMAFQVPQGGAIASGLAVGVMLDMRNRGLAKRISVDWESSNNNANMFLIARMTDLTSTQDAFSFAQGGGTSGTTTGSWSADWNYLQLFMFYNGGSVNAAADYWFKIRAVRIFTDASYESAGQSVLKASTVVNDALDRGTLLLSSDRSGIQTTAFNIPALDMDTQTTRQAWTGVDAYHNWLKMIDVNRRPIYGPLPSAPTLDYLPETSGDFNDASLNAGQEIYSGALVTGTAPSGEPVYTRRPQALSALVQLRTARQNTSVIFGSGAFAFLQTTPNIYKGLTYAVRVKSIVVTAFNSASTYTSCSFGNGTGAAPWAVGDIVAYPDIPISGNGTFGPYPWVLWTPTADQPRFGFSAAYFVPAGTGFTAFMTYEIVWGNTLPERRRFNRTMQLPINNLDAGGVAAAALSDIWLASHTRTPFKGTITATGDSSVRETLTGQSVSPGTLLLRTNQLIRMLDRVDGDTGNLGRDGRIMAVTYTPANSTALLTLDSNRDNLGALLSRMAVVVDNTQAPRN